MADQQGGAITVTGAAAKLGVSNPLQSLVLPTTTAVISVKQLWADEWAFDFEFELVRAVHAAGGSALGEMEFRRPYGQARSPADAVQQPIPQRDPVDIIGWWVQLEISANTGEHLAWVGQITAETKEVFSSGSARSGVQTFIAHEALQVLHKANVFESYWLVPIASGENPPTEERRLEWLPPMNRRNATGTLVGNKSDLGESGGSFLYGSGATWTRLDYATYLIKRFIDESDTGGPRWELAGQTTVLDQLTDTVEFGESASVGEMLRRLINPELGIDFVVEPIPESPSPGFQIKVFALSASPQTYAGFNMPANPGVYGLNTKLFPHAFRTRIARSEDQQYDRINVIGDRIVVCFSVSGADMEPKWSAAAEQAYINAGGPAATPEERDKARRSYIFDQVFTTFGVPLNWDFNGGTVTAPGIADDGDTLDFAVFREAQETVRRTLNWLPLSEGIDYSATPPVNNNPAGHVPSLLAPMAWLLDEEGQYIPATDVGHVSVPSEDWGITVAANSGNHLLANNHWSGESDIDPAYDYNSMQATVAMETDYRTVLRWEAASVPSKGRELNIRVPNAALWLVLPGTIVGVKNGELQRLTQHLIIRDDLLRMQMVMAGAIARYSLRRARATVNIKGHWFFSGIAGLILDVIQQGGATELIDGPITAVEYIGGSEPHSVIRAGYA